MRSVKLKANFFFLVLILLIASNGYSDTCGKIRFHTEVEAAANKTGKGLANFFTFNWSNLDFDEKLLQYIRVTAIKDQGINGYFNPRIQVCDYEGKDNCYQLGNGTSCRQIYGTQTSGAGVSAAVFIDWEGDTVLNDGKFKEGIAKGLEWEWVDNVTDEEKRKFANSPKICACSQKAACIGDFFSFFTKIGEGANIFRPGYMANTCDTCYQEKVKCAPVPLAPGPPPFCEQLAMSLPQVRIVPITDKDNDYFNPKVKVIAGDLIEEGGKIGKELDFPRKYKKDKAEELPTSDEVRRHSILDKNGTTHYFATYRKKDKLCAEYLGTQSIDEKNPQFVRCFPAPPAPEPKILRIVDANTLEIEMKMSESTCIYRAHGVYSNGLCTFNVTTHPVNIGPLSLKVVKPAIVAKTTDSNNEKSYIDNIIEGILESNPQQFKVLKEYDYVPDIETECKEFQGNKCKLNNLGQPEIEVKYKENSNSKMLCLSGWQPEPEEFVLERENKIIPLKLMGTKYIKYNAVYSKESNQFYYLPSKERETVDLLKIKRLQDQLDKIIFNKQGYVFFPDDNKQEKGKCSYCVDYDKDINEKFINNKVKVVYKLIDVEHREKCNQGDDGCICSDGKCSRSKQYLNKNENDKQFYLRYEEVDCKDKDGKVLRDEKNEVRKCTQLKDQLIKANRTEVFYADKLCRFDLEGLTEKLKEIIEKQLEKEKQEPEKKSEKSHDFGNGNHDVDGSQITSSHVEIEVWGSGEAGHIENTPNSCKRHMDTHANKDACSTETRAGMPGDYIKAELEIVPDYPIIKVKVSEGGGNQEFRYTDKDGGPIFVRKCSVDKKECKNLITMGGGGIYKMYPHENNYNDYRSYKSYMETIIDDSVKIKKETKTTGLRVTEDNKITYIENGEIKYETVKCSKGFRSSKPGAGGCIDKSKGIYGKGSAGQVKVTPIIKGFDKNIIKDAIEKKIGNQYDPGEVRDFSRSEFDTSLTKMIEEELKKELLR
ncbi:hypothetical protein [Wolbachia endosymbiont (group A) of Sicus ferrugineus]|uniref:hypothetical protein n=1 Tax=Wolbachia endosymbiont (group A) of Sicus ferrugineus TaxID=2954056 RepID=UPI002232A3A2|nr:hypothetical protein [Wolbachia endosymbiont (group A) of Sicus ferrugineus]